MMWQ